MRPSASIMQGCACCHSHPFHPLGPPRLAAAFIKLNSCTSLDSASQPRSPGRIHSCTSHRHHQSHALLTTLRFHWPQTNLPSPLRNRQEKERRKRMAVKGSNRGTGREAIIIHEKLLLRDQGSGSKWGYSSQREEDCAKGMESLLGGGVTIGALLST